MRGPRENSGCCQIHQYAKIVVWKVVGRKDSFVIIQIINCKEQMLPLQWQNSTDLTLIK